MTTWAGRTTAKMFWQLSNISNECCQDQRGKVFPLNQQIEEEEIGDECNTRKISRCGRSSGNDFDKYPKYNKLLDIVEDPESQIQLVFSPGTCCTHSSGLHPSNTSILEPKTCSIRTCRHSSWLRTVLHQRYQN